MILGPKLSHWNKKYCSGIYYFLCFYNFYWHDVIDEWYRLLLQFVTFGEFYDQKKSNLMILDNSGIDYARMLFVFGFLVYWNISTNSRASGNLRRFANCFQKITLLRGLRDGLSWVTDITGLDKVTEQDFFFSCPLYFFPQSFSSSYFLPLFHCLISLLLFPCSSVWENTRAWVPHFL